MRYGEEDEGQLKLHPADFLRLYNRLGVRFVASGATVLAQGAGVSPALAKWVAERSAWLLPWLDEQLPATVSRETLHAPKVQPERITPGERLYHKGLQNARRNVERQRAVVERQKARRGAKSGDMV